MSPGSVPEEAEEWDWGSRQIGKPSLSLGLGNRRKCTAGSIPQMSREAMFTSLQRLGGIL